MKKLLRSADKALSTLRTVAWILLPVAIVVFLLRNPTFLGNGPLSELLLEANRWLEETFLPRGSADESYRRFTGAIYTWASRGVPNQILRGLTSVPLLALVLVACFGLKKLLLQARTGLQKFRTPKSIKVLQPRDASHLRSGLFPGAALAANLRLKHSRKRCTSLFPADRGIRVQVLSGDCPSDRVFFWNENGMIILEHLNPGTRTYLKLEQGRACICGSSNGEKAQFYPLTANKPLHIVRNSAAGVPLPQVIITWLGGH